MRLIDAETLFEKVGKIKPKNKSEYELLGKFMNMITYSPTVERPHGEWKKDGFFAICSKCGHELQHYELVVSRLNFCPNCGADMRDKKDDLVEIIEAVQSIKEGEASDKTSDNR